LLLLWTKQNVDILKTKNSFRTPNIPLKGAFKDKRYYSRALKCYCKALDCLKYAFFVYFMSERRQLFDLELKISFRFDIKTRADHNFMFLFDLEMKRCCAVRERKIKQKRFIFQFWKGKKIERIIRFFMIEAKNELLSFTKNETLTSLLTTDQNLSIAGGDWILLFKNMSHFKIN
jgi:hypothetical protein